MSFTSKIMKTLVSLLPSCSNRRAIEVVTGSTIESGVALAGSQKFDLYLLDSWLPDGSGLDLCRQIREFDKATPIIFYSAAAYESDRDAGIELGRKRI